jgi:hypothetical protein
MCYGKLQKSAIIRLLLIIFSAFIVLIGSPYEFSLAGEKQEAAASFSKISQPTLMATAERVIDSDKLSEYDDAKYKSTVLSKAKPVDGTRNGNRVKNNRVKDSLTLIEKAYKKRKISKKRYLLLKADAIFKPEKLPKEFRNINEDKSDREFQKVNITAFINEIGNEWEHLDSDTQRQLGPLLLRPTDNPDNVILDKKTYNMAYAADEDTPYDTRHFRIHYVSSTNDAPLLRMKMKIMCRIM